MTCPKCGHAQPCAVYIRVSTQDQAKRGYSLPEQREQGERKAMELGYCRQCITVYEDVHTGSEMERPAFDRLREAIKAGKHQTVICLCPDRLGRNTIGMLLAYEELKAYRVRVEYVQIQVDGDTPEGNLFLQISAVFSEYERRKIVSRIRSGKERKVRESGRLPHHVRLYGYTFNRDTDLLEVHPGEAETVRAIFRWAAYGDGRGVPLNAGEICRRLQAMGIPRSDGGHRWHRSTVTRMLQREVYMTGKLLTYRWADARRTEERPADRQYAVMVPPLVDEATWRRANENLRARRYARSVVEPVPYLVRGLAYCGECGERMYTKHSCPRGRLFRYYYCPRSVPAEVDGEGTRSRRLCPQRWWNADVLERAVWLGLRPYLELSPPVLVALAVGNRDAADVVEAEYRQLLSRRDDVEQKLRRAVRLAVEGTLTDPEVRDIIADLRRQYAWLQAQLAAAGRRRAARRRNRAIDASVWHRYRDRLRDGSRTVQAQAVASFVHRVVCRADGHVIVQGYVENRRTECAISYSH